MKRRVAVRGIVVLDSKLLCFRLKQYDDRVSLKPGYWCTPGGGLDVGESLQEGLIREMFEETGIKPIVGNLLYVQQFVHHDTEQLEFFFNIKNSQDYIDIDLTKTSHGDIEIEEFNFVDPSKYPVLPKFLQTEPLDSLEHQTVKVFNYL